MFKQRGLYEKLESTSKGMDNSCLLMLKLIPLRLYFPQASQFVSRILLYLVKLVGMIQPGHWWFLTVFQTWQIKYEESSSKFRHLKVPDLKTQTHCSRSRGGKSRPTCDKKGVSCFRTYLYFSPKNCVWNESLALILGRWGDVYPWQFRLSMTLSLVWLVAHSLLQRFSSTSCTWTKPFTHSYLHAWLTLTC